MTTDTDLQAEIDATTPAEPQFDPDGVRSLDGIDEILDEDGYPTDEALEAIARWVGSPRVLLEDLLDPIFESYGGLSVTTDIDEYAKPVRKVRFATGGWSGCEHALSALRKNFFWFLWWETSARGGAHTFEIPEQSYDKPLVKMLPIRDTSVLEDTASVADMMNLMEQTVRTVPTTDVDPTERLLRGRIVVEEALEFAEALGLVITTPGHDLVAKDTVTVEIDQTKEIDLVETLDATADLIVVVKGSAHTFGLPVDDAFRIVHETNMAKAPGGVLIRRPEDNKILKPEGWVGPTEGLIALLRERGWQG
jgi:predicted HAD superfamily Cof-like phosphohydrolase